MLTDNRAFSLAHVFCPTDGPVKSRAKFDVLWFVLTHGRACPFTTLLSQVWLFCVHYLILPEEQKKSVSQIWEHLCRFGLKHRTITLGGEKNKECISKFYSHLGRGWEDFFHLVALGRWSGVQPLQSRLPGVSLSSATLEPRNLPVLLTQW